MNLRLLDIAEEDLIDGFPFYQKQPARIGSYFIESIYSDIESLRLYAGIHRRVLGYYRLLSNRFPYAIYCKLENDEIAIWRVLDCRRNPKWIQEQLKSGQALEPTIPGVTPRANPKPRVAPSGIVAHL